MQRSAIAKLPPPLFLFFCTHHFFLLFNFFCLFSPSSSHWIRLCDWTRLRIARSTLFFFSVHLLLVFDHSARHNAVTPHPLHCSPSSTLSTCIRTEGDWKERKLECVHTRSECTTRCVKVNFLCVWVHSRGMEINQKKNNKRDGAELIKRKKRSTDTSRK